MLDREIIDTPEKAKDFVQYMVFQRATIANVLRDFRNGLRNIGVQEDDIRITCYDYLNRQDEDLVNPIPSELRYRADRLQQSIPALRARMGSRDTEYYSACGYDDYIGNCIEECETLIQEYRYIATLLEDNII